MEQKKGQLKSSLLESTYKILCCFQIIPIKTGVSLLNLYLEFLTSLTYIYINDMHSLLELWHPRIANIKISSVESVVDCDFPWMSLTVLAQEQVSSALWVMAILMNPQVSGLS